MSQTKIRVKQIEQINAQNVNDALAQSAIPANRLSAYNASTSPLTDAELGYLAGVTSAIQSQINSKLNASVLKASTDSIDWTSDLVAVTAKAIASKIAAEVNSAQIGGVMVYKGAWTDYDSSDCKAGYTYCYDTEDAPTGLTVEVGDMLISKVDNPGLDDTANWTVVQSNITGAVTYVGNAVTDGGIVVFDGTTGKLIKGSTLNGLMKLVNGVPAVASASDLPAHTHTKNVHVNGANVGTFGDILKFKDGGAVTIGWDDTDKCLAISANISVLNGTVQSGKYVSGMTVSANGVLSLTFADLPTVHPKSDWVVGATPTGTTDGRNKVFTVSEEVYKNTEEVIINGQIITRGTDYTIVDRTITLSADTYIPVLGDVIRVNYIKA